MILKTAQCFYKNKGSVHEKDGGEYVRIDKPKLSRVRVDDQASHKRGSAKRLLEYPSDEHYSVSTGLTAQVGEQPFGGESPSEITPSFFSDIRTSEFVSVPININYGDAEDQCSSFIDYKETVFKSAQDRQRDVLFKYEDSKPHVLSEEEKSNFDFIKNRRKTMSRDRVPTRKG